MKTWPTPLPPRMPESAAAKVVAELRRMGLRTLLVSGDTQRTAEAVARQLSGSRWAGVDGPVAYREDRLAT